MMQRIARIAVIAVFLGAVVLGIVLAMNFGVAALREVIGRQAVAIASGVVTLCILLVVAYQIERGPRP